MTFYGNYFQGVVLESYNINISIFGKVMHYSMLSILNRIPYLLSINVKFAICLLKGSNFNNSISVEFIVKELPSFIHAIPKAT